MTDQVQPDLGRVSVEPLKQQIRAARRILGDQTGVLLHLIPLGFAD